MDVKELALQTVEATQAFGLTPQTAWGAYSCAYCPIIKMHEDRGENEFNRDLVTEFVRHIEDRFERGETALSYYRNQKRAVQRLTEMYDTGRLDYTAPQKKSGFIINEYYEDILFKYISGSAFSPKGISDATWVCPGQLFRTFRVSGFACQQTFSGAAGIGNRDDT
jgi:hypothetical protein